MFSQLLRFAFFLSVGMFLGMACCSAVQASQQPVELQVLKAAVGVWDAQVEVWAAGLDQPSIKFKAVETNRPFGKYWLVSDLDSQLEGETFSVHSIVGYDLDRKQLVGTVVDDGPYAASLTGKYDAASKTVHWITNVKQPDGTPVAQHTTVTQKTADERLLVLSVPGKKPGEFIKFMEIVFIRRK